MEPDNKMAGGKKRPAKKRSIAMNAQWFVYSTYVVYLVLMALVSLTGTAVLLKLIEDLFRRGDRRARRAQPAWDGDDA
jgi:hypothetical protein